MMTYNSLFTIGQDRKMGDNIDDFFKTSLDQEIKNYLTDNTSSVCSECTQNKCISSVLAGTSGCPDDKNMPKWLGYWNRAMTAYTEKKSDKFFILTKKSYKFLALSPLTALTGRVCPAPCQGNLLEDNDHGCVEQIGGTESVSIKLPEQIISDIAWEKGWVEEIIQEKLAPKNGKKVIIIGSGPAGYAASWKLILSGYSVELYEREAFLGGLLRYGIPSKKLPKNVVDREWSILEKSGYLEIFREKNITEADIQKFEEQKKTGEILEIIWAIGKETPRALTGLDKKTLEGASIDEVHFAMDFLQNHKYRELGESEKFQKKLDAKGKTVLVLGAGDTAEDSVHTLNLQQAKSIDMVIRKEEQIYKKTRKFGTAYKSTEIGSHHRFYGQQLTKISQKKSGKLSAQLLVDGQNTIEKEYDLILVAYGFVAPALDLPSEALVIGDAAHMSRDSSADLVVQAVADGVNMAEYIIKSDINNLKITDPLGKDFF